MASFVAKTVRGRRYWQIVTCQRLHGKPRQVVLAHLGTADGLLRKLQQAGGKPLKARVHDFGLLAAAFQLARQLRLVELIDHHVPKRHQGPSVGQYLLLAALNRLAQPTSKAKLAAWFAHTPLRRWLPFPRAALRSQRFWDHMAAVDEDAIRRIEADLSCRLVERFAIDLKCLCFDCTNFDTFIDSQTPAELPQRGHAKSKRTDLRIVGLALLVSTDFAIPLFSQTYPGNQPDSVTLASVTDTLAERYRLLARELEDVTLVFDKGNNSEDNLSELADGPYHVLGSLVPTQHPALLSIPLSRFRPLADKRLEGVRAYRTTQEVYGRTWTLVVTRSDKLLRGQLRGIAQHLRKRRRALAELRRKLRRSQRPGASGKGYTLAGLQKHARELSRGQYIKDILRIEVSQEGGRLSLRYRTDRQALAQLRRTVLGKCILFTDNHDWTTAEIILGYRSQHHVERAFRQMKGRTGLSWEPVHHWTDQKIRVHSFYCVLALTLLNLLHRQAWQAGIQVSAGRLVEELAGLREVIHLYPPGGPGKAGRYRAETTYTELTPVGARLVQLFQLDQLQVR
jgi:transposase